MMEDLQGTVAAIVFQSADGVFCVLRLKRKDNGQSVTAAGQIGVPAVGRSVTLRGCWVQHPRFGMQFKAVSMTEQMPERSEDIEQYLASGEIEGIGPAMARRIVDAFGSRTLEILDRNPEALLSVPGIGERKLEKIRASYAEGAALRSTVLLLQNAGVPARFASVLQKAYGEGLRSVLEKEPYRMVREISGMSFQMADRIAMAEGI